jgi:hypothetical protein
MAKQKNAPDFKQSPNAPESQAISLLQVNITTHDSGESLINGVYVYKDKAKKVLVTKYSALSEEDQELFTAFYEMLEKYAK